MQIQSYGSPRPALLSSQGPTVIHSELIEGELCPEHLLACGPAVVKCLDFGALRLLTSLLFSSKILKGCVPQNENRVGGDQESPRPVSPFPNVVNLKPAQKFQLL